MVCLISAFEGLSQLTGSSVSADGMSGGESGVGRFSSSLKCSAHRFSCSLVVVGGFLFLSITGLVCLLEFARRLLDHQVQVPQISRGAAVSACLAMLSISSSFPIAQVCNIL